MQTPERVIGGAVAVLLALSATAAGQSSAAWQINRGDNFVAAGICQPGSDRHCVRLQCLTMEGGDVSWGIDAPEPGYSAESASVTWTIDGATVLLPMNKAGPADNGIQSYDAAFSQSDHQTLVQRLKSGNRLTLGSDQFAAFNLSLRGSGAALTTLLAECPLIASTDTPSAAATVEQFSEPFDAVLAMAAKQECEATEAEIFTAITDAGFSDWDANQFVAIGAKDGTLQLIDRVDFKYRVTKCKAEKNALAVNSDATELAVTADQLPQPVRSTINDIAAMCGNAFLTEGRSPEALLADDIDGDGTYDFLLDHAQFCPDAILTMCGVSHCPMTLFVSDKGAWQRFDFILQGYKEFTAQGFLFQCNDPAQKAGVFMENGKLIERNCR
jgi:hypothetical protein